MTLGSHQGTIGKSQSHLTPRSILDALGEFDLDPCAADPRPWDCAKENYTEQRDGLSLPWGGRVWLNPPFHRYMVGQWVERMVRHGRGTMLLHARTETAWFAPVWRSAAAILFLSGRVTFCKADGSPQTIASPSSKYFGKAANSGAPVALAAFGQEDARLLDESGLKGSLVRSWAVR
jgi:hypothetical protein